LVLFIAVQSYFLMANLNNEAAKYMYVEFYQPFVFIGISMIGCTFMIFLTCWMDKKKIMPWLTVLGKYSLYIYVAHVIVFAAVRTIMTHFLHINDAVIIIFTGMLFGITVPVFLYRLAERFNMRWIFTLEKQKTIAPDKNNNSELEAKVKTG